MFFSARVISLTLMILAASCTTTIRETLPARTATEQLMTSIAIEQAVERLPFNVPAGAKIYLDASNLTGVIPSNGDDKYAISAIKERLLKEGGQLVADKKEADLIVEIRSGALSIDRMERLFGIPSFSIPIPLAGSLKFPEIAFYKKVNLRGVVRFSFFVYDAKSGALYTFSGPIYGGSHRTKGRVLIYSWTDSDVEPK